MIRFHFNGSSLHAYSIDSIGKYTYYAKVPGLMPLCMYGLVHKPSVGSFWHLMLLQPVTSEKKVLAQSFHV